MSLLIYEKSEHYAVFTLNRPEVLNAFNEELRTAFLEAMDDFNRDPAMRVGIVTGSGRAFCVAGGGGRYSHLVTHIWDRALANFDAAEAIEIVKRHGGWAFPKHDYRSLLASEQVEAVGMLIDVPAADGSPLRMQAPPWEFADTPASVRLHPPALGEHTDAVLGAVPHRGAS